MRPSPTSWSTWAVSGIVSSITVEAADELGLAEGSAVTVIVKASDVILATG